MATGTKRGAWVERNVDSVSVRCTVPAWHNPDTITDQATYEEPLQPTTGMQNVLVNGTPIIEAGQAVPFDRLSRTLPGRHLRCER